MKSIEANALISTFLKLKAQPLPENADTVQSRALSIVG